LLVFPSCCLFFFFFFIRPFSRSTLFPYTTLFRSWPTSEGVKRGPGAAPSHSSGLCQTPDSGSATCRNPLWRFHQPPAWLRPVARDRKSTRLNSSHVSISYAVFCLKKKKNEAAETQ